MFHVWALPREEYGPADRTDENRDDDNHRDEGRAEKVDIKE